MWLEWRIDDADIAAVRRALATHAESPVVRARRQRNLAEHGPAVTRPVIWRALVAALVGSRQRSGRGHPVTRFLLARPFPLDYERCHAADDAYELIQQTLRACGGMGRFHRVVDHLERNLDWLSTAGWHPLESRIDRLHGQAGPGTERDVADWLDEVLAGYGPRESRRMLSMLGLTRFEVPLDARLVRWLNRLPVAPRLSAAALADRSYHGLVLDGVRQLAAAGDTLPCLLEASILAASGLPDDDATCW